MNKLDREFLSLLQLLNENNVEYLVIGGYAVNFYGYARPTGDLDIWVNPTTDNRSRLVEALEHYRYNTKPLLEKDFTQPVVFELGVPPFKIDVINRISGMPFPEAYARRIISEVEGINICFINLQDLITNKLCSGRHKDLDDLENLPGPSS